MAGNVPLFTAEGTQAALVAGCARHLARAGRLVAGFQLDRRYPLDDYDEHCRRAGLASARSVGHLVRRLRSPDGDLRGVVHQWPPVGAADRPA